MEASGKTGHIQCIECGRIWLSTDADRWRAFWHEEGPRARLVFYCAACAEREFPRHDGRDRRAPEP